MNVIRGRPRQTVLGALLGIAHFTPILTNAGSSSQPVTALGGLEGRFFHEADIASPVLPMLVNASFAKRYLSDGKGVAGRRFTGLLGGDDSVVEVVGVVADVLPASLDAEPQAQIYTLHGRATKMGNATFVVRTHADPSTLAPLLRCSSSSQGPRSIRWRRWARRYRPRSRSRASPRWC